MAPDAHYFLHMVIQTLQLLAADNKTQVDVLPSFVVVPDELTQTYYDSLCQLDQIEEAGLLDHDQVVRLREIDHMFDRVSEEDAEHFYSLDAMRDDTASGVL